MTHLVLLAALCPGQVIVAADQSSQSWQDRADFHCRDEVDDAVTLRAAAKRAAKDKEIIQLAPGLYRQRSSFKVPAGVQGVAGMGQAYLAGTKGYAGWLMEANGLLRAKVEGIGFQGANNPSKFRAKGLRIDDCHDSKFERLHFVGCAQALKVDRGWCLYIEAIRLGWCRRPDDPFTLPLIELNQFGASSLRGVAIVESASEGPMLAVNGAKATIEDIAIEDCQSDDCMILYKAKQSRLSSLHFEDNACPVQIRADGCRQSRIFGVGLACPVELAVEVGVSVTNSRDTLIDGVIATHCSDAMVRIDFKSASNGCTAERIDLHYDRDKYGGKWPLGPRHMVDYAGPGSE